MMTNREKKAGRATGLTQRDAATAYAKAWNRLDPGEFIDMLSPDVRYSSQWVLEDLHGKKALADYLRGKMATVKKSAATVYAEVAQIGTGDPCVLLAQGNRDDVNALVLFTVDQNKVTGFDMCIPDLYGSNIRSGMYPS